MREHLAPDALLRVLDGELPRLELRHYQQHLHSCWKCRAALEQLEQDLGFIVRAQDLLENVVVAPPPRPWRRWEPVGKRDVRTSRSFSERSSSLGGLWRYRPIRMATAVVVLCVGALLAMLGVMNPAAVSAKEVLEKVSTSTSGPNGMLKEGFVARQKIQLTIARNHRTPGRPVVLDVWKSNGSVYWADDEESTAKELQNVYVQHGIPLDLPLVNRSAVAWKAITSTGPLLERNSQGFRLSFVDHSNNIPARVDLDVLSNSWQVKRLTLDFDDTTYQLSEISFAYVPESELSDHLRLLLKLPLQARTPILNKDMPFVARIGSASLAGSQLEVDLALHALDADLGEPITISRVNGMLRVDLTAEGVQRQEEIMTKLAGIRDLQIVRSHRAETPIGFSRSVATITTTTSMMKDPDAELLHYFGSVEREVDFTRSALEVSGALLAHAHLLHRLDQEFQSTERQALSVEESRRLDELIFEETKAFRADCRSLNRLMEPLSRHFVLAPGAVDDVPSAGEAKTRDAAVTLAEARRVDQLTRGLLTSNSNPLLPEPALRELNALLHQLSSLHTTFLGKGQRGYE